MTHGSHVVSSSNRASLDSEDTSPSAVGRHSREYGHRRSHEHDLEAQNRVIESLHPHVRIKDNPDHHQYVEDEEPSNHAPAVLLRTETSMSKASIKSLRRRGRAE